MGASGIAASEFPGLRLRPKGLTSSLPLFLYLIHHDRGVKTKTGTAADLIGWVKEWVAASPIYRDVATVDITSAQLAKILREVGVGAGWFNVTRRLLVVGGNSMRPPIKTRGDFCLSL